MLEKLQQMIAECLPIVKIELTANGEFTIYSEFGIPLVVIENDADCNYVASTLTYNHYDGDFQHGAHIYTGFLEDAVKKSLAQIVTDKVSYFLEWQDAQATVYEIEGWDV